MMQKGSDPFKSLNGERSMGGVYNPVNLALFSYTQQNPVKLVDPDGNESYQSCWLCKPYYTPDNSKLKIHPSAFSGTSGNAYHAISQAGGNELKAQMSSVENTPEGNKKPAVKTAAKLMDWGSNLFLASGFELKGSKPFSGNRVTGSGLAITHFATTLNA